MYAGPVHEGRGVHVGVAVAVIVGPACVAVTVGAGAADLTVGVADAVG